MRTALALLLMAAGPASAQDYPFTGYFLQSLDEVATGRELLSRCALSFFHQSADGSYASYALNYTDYAGDGTISYEITNYGGCAFDAATSIEECTFVEDYAAGQSLVSYSVITSMTPERIEAVLADDRASAEAYASTREGGQGRLVYYRCPIDETVVGAALKMELTKQSEKEVEQVTMPTREFLSSPDVKALGKLLRD